MRNSLTELHLENGMINSRDYNLFREFTQLKELYVGRNLLKDIFDCDRILKHLPQLAKFSVESFRPNDNMEPVNDERHNNSTTKYSNLKSLHIRKLVNCGKKELDYLMETFTSLQYFSATGNLKTSISGESVNRACMKSFIQFVSNIEYGSICFTGISDGNWLMDMYPICQDNTSQEVSCKLNLHISLVDADLVFNSTNHVLTHTYITAANLFYQQFDLTMI